MDAGYVCCTVARVCRSVSSSSQPTTTRRASIHLRHKSLNGLIRSLLMSQGDSESVPYIDRSASGPRNELSKSRGLNQWFWDAVDPNVHGRSSYEKLSRSESVQNSRWFWIQNSCEPSIILGQRGISVLNFIQRLMPQMNTCNKS